MHLDEDQIERVIHGELPPAGESSVREHLSVCDDCRGRVGDARREEARIIALLETIDRPVPAMPAGSARRTQRDGHSTWLRRAAAMVTGLAIAGAAYAAPGSPVRSLFRRVVTHRIDRPSPVIRRDLSSSAPTAGIAVSPGAHLTIDITGAPPTGPAMARLVDGDEVVVRAIGGRPTFRSERDRLVIDGAITVSELAIEIPRRAPFVEIRLDGRRALRKDGPDMIGATPDSVGRYTLTVP
jgi:anti-sigma factor RsiW